MEAAPKPPLGTSSAPEPVPELSLEPGPGPDALNVLTVVEEPQASLLGKIVLLAHFLVLRSTSIAWGGVAELVPRVTACCCSMTLRKARSDMLLCGSGVAKVTKQ